MVEAARTGLFTASKGLDLISLDKESDKFYGALGMSRVPGSNTRFAWNQSEMRSFAMHVQKKEMKKEKPLDVQALLEAAKKAEEKNPPLAGCA